VRLRAQLVYLGDRYIGEVFVPIDDLLAGADKGGDPRPLSYQVRRPHSGRAHGVLYFCYKVTDVPAAACPGTGRQTRQVRQVRAGLQEHDGQDDGAAHRVPTAAIWLAVCGVPAAALCVRCSATVRVQCCYPTTGNVRLRRAAGGCTREAWRRHGDAAGQYGGGMAVGGMMLGEAIGDYKADAAYDAGFNDALAF